MGGGSLGADIISSRETRKEMDDDDEDKGAGAGAGAGNEAK